MDAGQNSYLMNIITVIGFILTIIGLIVAIQQIRKTRKAAEASKLSAEKTQETIKKNVALSDISICIKIIEEIKTSLRNESFESAMLRTTDLLSQLIQLRHLHDGVQENIAIDLKLSLAQLSNIQDILEKRIKNSDYNINTKKCNVELSRISKYLNDWLGSTKFSISKGA